MKRNFFFGFILFVLSGISAVRGSSFEFNDRVQQAYLRIIRLKFDEGKILLDEEKRLNPSNVLPELYYNYIDFLKTFISEDVKEFEAFKKNLSERQRKLSDEDSPYNLYVRSEMMLQEAMLRIKFREFITAAWEIRKSYKLIEKNANAFAAFPLNKKILGFLHVMVGAIPKNYRWMIDITGVSGTIPQGTEELNSLLRETETGPFKVYREEILFYLANINNSFNPGEGNSSMLIGTIQPFCRHSELMRYCYINLLMKAGRNDEILQMFTDTFSTEGTYPFYFLSYKTGMAKFRKLDLTSEKDFENFIKHFKGINYLRSAYQKIAWIYLLEGETEKYAEAISFSGKVGADFIDEDKDATKEANDGIKPNLILLRARLLFDGGYYTQSMAEIGGKGIENFPTYRDQLEVTYRLARIYLKLKQTDKAIDYFEQTFKNGASSSFYFAANSALMLGNIYEERNDHEKSRSNYTRCLSLRKHEYQNSIDQKAEAGLERLNVKK